jgi:hypothetical protein
MCILKELIELVYGNAYASRTSEGVSCCLHDDSGGARTMKISMRICRGRRYGVNLKMVHRLDEGKVCVAGYKVVRVTRR